MGKTKLLKVEEFLQYFQTNKAGEKPQYDLNGINLYMEHLRSRSTTESVGSFFLHRSLNTAIEELLKKESQIVLNSKTVEISEKYICLMGEFGNIEPNPHQKIAVAVAKAKLKALQNDVPDIKNKVKECVHTYLSNIEVLAIDEAWGMLDIAEEAYQLALQMKNKEENNR